MAESIDTTQQSEPSERGNEFGGHSVIENTWGAVRGITNPETRLKVIEGIEDVLKYERLQALKQRPDADSDWLLFVDGSPIDFPPQFF